MDSSTGNHQVSVQHGDFQLSDWIVKPSRNTLVHGNKQHVVEPKLMAMLEVLAANHGQVVTKNELLEHVWPNRFVVEGVLKRGVSELRKIFNDDARAPRFIETVYKTGYRLMVKPQAVLDAVPAGSSQPIARPYPGLRSFDLSDDAVFFGREAEIVRVVKALETQASCGRSFALVVGASGCGKSSLVIAGVMQALLKDASRATVSAVQRCEKNVNDPVGGLIDALQASPFSTLENASGQALVLLRDQPESGLQELYQVLEKNGKHLVLVIDQFEQLLHTRIPQQLFTDYVSLIYGLGRSGHVSIIATLRSDYLPKFLETQALVDLKNPHGQVELNFPGFAQLGRMIRFPAQLTNVQFEKNQLGDALDDALHDAAATQPNSLPLLQFTLSELFKHRQDHVLTWEAYETLGGLNGCIANRAEAVFESLPVPAQDALPQVLRQLVTQIDVSSSPANAQQSLADYSALLPNAKELVDQFLDARLFSSYLNAQGRRGVSLAHEALLSHWPRAQALLQSDRRLISAHARLSTQAKRWRKDRYKEAYLLAEGTPLNEAVELLANNFPVSSIESELIKDSQQRIKRVNRVRRFVVGVVAAVSLAATVAGVQAMLERSRATAQAVRATRVSEFVTGLFRAADPAKAGETQLRQILDRGAAQLSQQLSVDEPEIAADYLATIGNAYRGLSSYAAASNHLEQAIVLYTQAGAENSLAAARAKTWLAKVRIKTRDLDKAKSLLDESLQFHREVSLQSADFADTTDTLAMLHYHAGQFEMAARAANSALAVRRDALGAYHYSVADTLNNLAAINIELKLPEQARQGLQEAAEIYRRQPDSGSFKLANTLNNLGDVATSAENFVAAENHYREALTLRRSIYGDSHSDTAAVKANLGSLLLRLGNAEESNRLLGEAYTTAHSTLGDDHIYTSLFAVKFAESSTVVGDHQRALELLGPSIKVLQLQYGEQSWIVARALSVKGAALLAMGQTEEAGELLYSSHEILNQALGDQSPYTQSALARLQVYRDSVN
ncbi:MAG: tetratricopeptide repeat protein [Gammaproteobacteria bacterium]